MKHIRFFAPVLLSLLIAGCASAFDPAPAGPDPSSEEPPITGAWSDQSPRTDEQGEVTVAITPINLSSPGETLDFQVSLDTHSVDLSMDLAALATLATDKGVVVQAAVWDAPLGGHHVSGILSFPVESGTGAVLESASTLTLRLVDVDAGERVFVWEK